MIAGLVLGSLSACTEPSVPPALQLPTLPPAEAMEPAVREQFTERRDLLKSVLADAETPATDIAWAFGQMGRVYHAYRDLDQARRCYAEAHRLDPELFDWAYLLGHVDLVLGQTASAKTEFERAHTLRPTIAEPLAALGRIAHESGDLEAAKAHFLTALELAPRHVLARYGLALVEIDSGLEADAIERLLRLLKEQPDAFQIRYALGDALKKIDRLEEAREYLDAIPSSPLERVGINSPDPWMGSIASLPVSVTALERRGRQALLKGRVKEALQYFRRAEAAAPERRDVRFNLATALVHDGLPEEAREHLRFIVNNFPDFDGAHRLLGRIELKRRPAFARQEFERALALDDSADNRLALADWFLHVGETRAAITAYEHSLAASSKTGDAHVGRVLSLLLDGQVSAAQEALREASIALPRSPRLAWLGLRIGKATSQRKFFPSAPRSVFELETAAMVRASEGEFGAAVGFQKKAIRRVGEGAHRAVAEARLQRYRDGRTAARLWEPSDRARVRSSRTGSPSRKR